MGNCPYDREQLLRDNGWKEEDFAKTKLEWAELDRIYIDYSECRPTLQAIPSFVYNGLQELPEVHSIRHRIKSPISLVAKIIRKTLDDPGRVINVGNYYEEITDLVGVRTLHLFKGQWLPIHKFILAAWDQHEDPIAYIREGDPEDDFNGAGCKIKLHGWGYRSLHHVVKTKPGKKEYLIEIQVRTIFEEGWSEIDHRVRYPRHSDNPVLEEFIRVFNRFAGNADEMGTFVAGLATHIRDQSTSMDKLQADLLAREEDLKVAFEQIDIAASEKEKLLGKVHALQQSSQAIGRIGVNATLDAAFGTSIGPIRIDQPSILLNSSALYPLSNSVITMTKKCSVCGEDFAPVISGYPDKCSKCKDTFIVHNPNIIR